MLKNRPNSPLKIIIAILSFSWALPASAYLDPGTGSMLIQGIIGAIAALSVTINIYWHKIRSIFSNREPEDKSADDTNSET